MQLVWQDYHSESKSSTVEVHLYRLKQKLPPGLLTITKDYAKMDLPQILSK